MRCLSTRHLGPLLLFVCLSLTNHSAAEDDADRDLGSLSKEAREFAEKFAPRGAQADNSPLVPAKDTLSKFTLRDGIAIDLIASEPLVSQPLFMTWDHRGRLWVIQYLQYPFPAGLEIVKYDQYLRAVFDRVPAPPPEGPKGADKITILEDTNGDGTYDKSKDALTGLNLATAVLPGHEGFWVLQPPYLLNYQDKDRNDVPDSDPVVHLSGFGLEDTHSLANSLRWGPDGWIYGVNGSTTTANISSAVSKNISWKGQCIWRYHPTSKVFEIYAEGGGNTFSLDIDSVGRVFSGTNGGRTRGMHYEQGSYGSKNWGKHGPLTNPYAFGYFNHMAHEGDSRRFAQAFAIYEGGLFGGTLDNKIIAPNALHNIVWTSQIHSNQSTFKTIDEEPLMKTSDRWFRPVDCKVGPDGGIYIADWADTRLSHVNPIDDWHKSSGRLYRVRPTDSWSPTKPIDLTRLSSERLIALLDHGNKRIRRGAVLEIGWRKDQSVAGALIEIATTASGQKSIEALWALHLLGQFDDIADKILSRKEPAARRIAVRLIGDTKKSSAADISADVSRSLIDLAGRERNPEVRAQLAATSRRLPSEISLQMLWNLAGSESGEDSRLKHLIWWGIEDLVSRSPDLILAQLNQSDQGDFFEFANRLGLTSKLSKRFAISGPDGYTACITLLDSAPDKATKSSILDGIMEAFEGSPIPDQLSAAMRTASKGAASELVVAIRSGDTKATTEAIKIIADSSKPMHERLTLVATLGEAKIESSIKPLINLLAPPGQYALKRASLKALGNFDNPDIASNILRRWQSSLPDEHGLRETAQRVLAGRKEWAVALLKEVNAWRIPPNAILPDVLQQAALYHDAEIDASIAKSWPDFKPLSSKAKLAQIKKLRATLTSKEAKAGDPKQGKIVYEQRCAACHKLFGEGSDIAPDLTGYERSNLDFWLPAIIDPGLELREGYVTHIAETKDGRMLVGFVAERGANSITLRDPAGNINKVTNNDLKKLTASPVSLMPEGLLNGLDEDSLRNLFAYLMKEDRR